MFAVITLLRLYNHIPWFDEAHSWTISEQLGFIDMIKYISQEGHFPLWNILLYPFAKLHLYPLSMKLLNWTFCFGAICLLWWKFPVNNLTKIFITFSFPFLACYSVVARCYAVGIFLLFIIVSMYKKQLEKPILYSCLIFLCANTSLMALVPCFGLSLIFGVKLILQKKFDRNFYIPTAILLLLAGVILLQILNVNYDISKDHVLDPAFSFNIFVRDNLFVNLLLLIAINIPVLKYLSKDKYSLFFIIINYFIYLLMIFKLYGFNFWHSGFIFVYLILAFWIRDEQNETYIWKKLSVIALTILSFIYVFYVPSSAKLVFASPIKKIMKFIESDDNLKNAHILHNYFYMYEIRPYTYKTTYKLKNYCNLEDYTDYNLYKTLHAKCSPNAIEHSMQHQYMFKEYAKLQPLYFVVSSKTYKNSKEAIVLTNEDYYLHFTRYKCYDAKFCFWKMEVKH